MKIVNPNYVAPPAIAKPKSADTQKVISDLIAAQAKDAPGVDFEAVRKILGLNIDTLTDADITAAATAAGFNVQ